MQQSEPLVNKMAVATQVNNLTTVSEQTSHAITFSIFEVFAQADTITRFVILILCALSIFGWTIFFDKILFLSRVEGAIKVAEDFFWNGYSISDIVKRLGAQKKYNPALEIIVNISEEIGDRKASSRDPYIIQTMIDNISDISFAKITTRLQSRVAIIEGIANNSVFLGLFGMVWATIMSFRSVATMKSVSLVVIAPRIAEALMTTALGLAVAIPAAIFAHVIVNKINAILTRLYNIKSALSNIFLHDI